MYLICTDFSMLTGQTGLPPNQPTSLKVKNVHNFVIFQPIWLKLGMYIAYHKKGNSCSIRYFSWKKWVFGIFFLRYGKSVIKWSQCHKSHEIISISKDFIVKRRYGIRICVWTVNFSKEVKKGIFFIWFLSFAVQEINWYHRPFERYSKELSYAANLTFLAQFV